MKIGDKAKVIVVSFLTVSALLTGCGTVKDASSESPQIHRGVVSQEKQSVSDSVPNAFAKNEIVGQDWKTVSGLTVRNNVKVPGAGVCTIAADDDHFVILLPKVPNDTSLTVIEGDKTGPSDVMNNASNYSAVWIDSKNPAVKNSFDGSDEFKDGTAEIVAGAAVSFNSANGSVRNVYDVNLDETSSDINFFLKDEGMVGTTKFTYLFPGFENGQDSAVIAVGQHVAKSGDVSAVTEVLYVLPDTSSTDINMLVISSVSVGGQKEVFGMVLDNKTTTDDMTKMIKSQMEEKGISSDKYSDIKDAIKQGLVAIEEQKNSTKMTVLGNEQISLNSGSTRTNGVLSRVARALGFGFGSGA